MNEILVEGRHFEAELTREEYIRLRVNVAKRCIRLKDWITEAIQEKLEKVKED